ncbi:MULTISPECIES: tetratricopeptide repeat protein [Rhodobacterales]|jgi:Tfp pilus assembly protein PilF|uniref:tetratricopeptide repeat protein n=1 Tax=Rhodobacterales TaxID=204455 RepID=UPI00237FB493|nr:tetratricopeptide repeat protein [Phaeobacter gallaeciensis]MDE4140533.1 tetratricopeptide repeat protein [Phaeobacter gallaeciensis]MDE4148774.1 tetratricopeptide repeat protein [Phaeobacter gallaeciensis]MDE4152996.1 tetratricopeptide repeat protein [Phaeobacter gallaeciensis]MDE4228590.1 tetratricopeptide repeat protein [Phaeobacter gallaeciensis]MDE4257666.1 tetratricopeptide repeat protein [Phaeobacter gallaeciensis]
MRQSILVTPCLIGALALSACVKPDGKETVERAFQDVNVVDEHNLNDVMLTVADPNEAVNYFQKSLKSAPDRIDFQRGLATSMIRAKRNTEAASAWKKVAAHPEATVEDKVSLADALIRTGDWKGAKAALDSVPPTHETYRRYRLEAMVADANKEWKRADSFYEIATGLTTQPAKVMNNWGYSKLSRGSYAQAERLFSDAIRQDPSLFTAKNNLVLARGAQRNYTLPVIPLDQTERAQLLHTLALSAVKQGDVKTGENLLREAITTHPQHFEAAARSLAALENG